MVSDDSPSTSPSPEPGPGGPSPHGERPVGDASGGDTFGADASGADAPDDSPSRASGEEDAGSSFSYRAELKRKALHIFALVVPLGMGVLGTRAALWLLVPVTILAVAADVLRAYSAPFSRFIRWVFGPLMRETELPPLGSGVVLNGATSVLVGATLLTLLFPIDVAAPVFAMVMIADAAAALVGRRWGRHRWPGSTHTVEGSLAFVGVGMGVVAWVPSLTYSPAAVAVAAGGVVTAAVVEAAPLPLNDNIRVPLAAALLVTTAQTWLLGHTVTWGVFGLAG